MEKSETNESVAVVLGEVEVDTCDCFKFFGRSQATDGERSLFPKVLYARCEDTTKVPAVVHMKCLNAHAFYNNLF